MLPLLLFLLLVSPALADSDPCPAGAIYNDALDVCYIYNAQASSFVEAERNCVSMGGQLAKIMSGFENTLINEIAPFKFPHAADYWVGGFLNSIQKQWMWIDWTAITYNKWGPSQPAPYGQCVSVQTTGGKWQGDVCKTAKPSVCMTPSSAVRNATCPTPAPSTCPPSANVTVAPTASHVPCRPSGNESWIYYQEDQSCFWSTVTSSNNYLKMTFDDSERLCQSLGGELASIHSDKELNFVEGLLFNQYQFWSSIHYVDGLWESVDGSPIDYGWNTTKIPTDANHFCIQISPYTVPHYQETNCLSDNYTVCKKKAFM